MSYSLSPFSHVLSALYIDYSVVFSIHTVYLSIVHKLIRSAIRAPVTFHYWITSVCFFHLVASSLLPNVEMFLSALCL